MKYLKNIMLTALAVAIFSCESDWLEREPNTVLVDDQVWNDPQLVLGTLSNYYNRLPAHYSLTAGWTEMAAYTDAMWSGFANNEGLNNIPSYPIFRWAYWDYGLIRDINLAIDKIETESTELSEEQKQQFIAELRFLRAYVYFEMVKRMGGVPLVTEQLIYDFSGDPSSLQFPRSKEEEVYDFIASEVDAIADQLGNAGSQTRANRFTALAMKSRAMLYAASIAKYNNQLPVPITTPGGEVGISAARAEEYYNKSLEASRIILTEGPYTLYESNPNLGENFYEAVTGKTNNTEAIWVQDFLLSADKRHLFAYDNIVRSVREDNLSSSAVTPSLQLVEHFEYLDGTSGELKTRTDDDSDYIYYDNPEDIFANKDARLYGTVVYPGAPFKGQAITIQAGVMVWNGTGYDVVEDALNTTYDDGGILTALAGPNRTTTEVTNTGFYLRKHVDSAPQSSTRGIQSDTWWVRFRLGEIYLNATEAAYELGLTSEALGYINRLRQRAGFPENSLGADGLTMARIRNERRVELAFEDHRVWDLKRWRMAHEVWNGDVNNPEANVNALYPYRVVRPDDPTKNGKYVFMKLRAPRFLSPRLFQLNNYYSEIPNGAINNNPKLVRNPFH
uniref:RagB/SusD family nutrient uptake outer membrane protein n=1 Tax=Roseihalotalea indica TaxID=2867963 RepID=A0AA49GN20_9BACT|nr:RagB/SusD family nutrient uptake outer membrane protein [Tunicatimonas sp. TK19036]